MLHSCLAGHRAAQRQLYDRTLPYLHLVCRRYLRYPADLKDALQESYVAIFAGLGSYDPARANFKTWSTRVAINVCLRHNERYARRSTDELVVNLHEPAVSPEAYARLSAEELIAWLRRMPTAYFTVFNAHVIDGFSHQEIARLYGIEPELSRQRLRRARKWLKKHLPADFDPAQELRGDYNISALALLIWAFAFSLNLSISNL